jgi:gliding motility-associated-like protein
MIYKTNLKQLKKGNKDINQSSFIRFLNLALCIAIIFCSTLTVQSAENSAFEPLNSKKTPIPELSKKDRASTINFGDTVVFDYSQAVFVNGNLKFPVSIITDDTDVFSLDFQFRFNTVDFTYDQVLNTNTLTSLLGNFNPADQILRVFSFDDNVLPNNTDLLTLSFNTTSTEFCALNPFNVLVYLNGEPCSYKFIGCANDPANAGSDQSICADSTVLSANSIFVGSASWSVISGSGIFSNVISPSSSVSGLSAGENIFRWTFPTISSSPGTFDEVTIFRNSPPSIAFAGDDYTECLNSTTLPAEIPTIGTGAWTLLAGPSGSIQDFTNPNSLFTFTLPGVYDLEWRTSSGNCPQTADTIRIEKLESANAGADIFVCENQTTLTAVPSSIYSGYWTVVSGTGVFEDSTSATTNVSGLSLGENIFTWTLIGTNCPVNLTDSVSVNILEQSLANAGVDQIICGNSALLGAVFPTFGSGIWTSTNPSVIFADNSDFQTTVSNLSYGVDTLIWTTSNGVCSSVDSVFITSFEQTQALAGEDQTVCGNSTQLSAVNQTIGNGIWTSTNPSVIFADASDFQTTASNLSFGVDTLIWTTTNGSCSSVDSIIITSIELLQAFAGVDQTVCGDSALLEAVNPTVGSGIWSSVNTSVIFTDATNYQTAVSNLSFGVDTLIWTVTNGICTSVDSVFITSNILLVTNAGEDLTICGNSTLLAASNPANGTGVWTSLNASVIIAEPSNPLSAVSNLSFGVDTLVWTVTIGACISVDSVFITSNVLSIANAGENQNICETSTVLAATNPTNGTGVWTSSNAAVLIAEPSNPLSAVSNLTGLDTLVWTVTNGACISIDSVFITSNNLLVANAGEDQTNCGNSTLLAASIPENGTGIWTSLNSAVLIEEPSNPLSAVSNLSFGVDTLVWTVTIGTCTSVDSVFITSNIQPQVNVGLDTTICDFQQSITIPISASGYTSISWEILLGNGEVNDQTTLFPSFNNMSIDQNNSFEIIVKNGLCAVYDTLNIYVYGDESQFCNTRPIFIPEGFSPNGDGTYDLFQILNLNGLNADVKIFNRWGDLVFSDPNYQNNWDGKSNNGLVVYGEELPAGTYFYIIQIEGEAEPRKDYLTLWR